MISLNNTNIFLSNSIFIKIYHANRIHEIIFLSVIITANFVLADQLRDNLLVARIGDEIMMISVATDFQENHDFRINYSSTRIYDRYQTVDEIIANYPNISEQQSGKGPIFFILLGSFFYVTDPDPEDRYLHASLFNTLVSSVFLFLFFYFIKRRFGLLTALISTTLVAFAPYFLWESARSMLRILSHVFMLTAIFFIAKNKTNYFLFGLLTGLGHLTHPFAFFLGFTYSIFLLVNREFKGFLITVGTWFTIMIPWMIRNYYHFKDIGYGLYIPFSDKISRFLTFLPTDPSLITKTQNHIPQQPAEIITAIGPLETVSGLFQTSLANLYHMEYLVYFLIIFSVFSYFQVEKISKLTFKTFTYIIIIVAFFAITVFLENNFLQIFAVFIVPPILVYIFFKKYGYNLFLNNISRLSKFIALLGFVYLISYYYYAVLHNRTTPDSYQLMFAIFLAVPIAVTGFLNLARILRDRFFVQKRTGIVFSLFFLFLLTPIFYQYSAGIERLDNYRWGFGTLTEDMTSLNKILQTFPSDTIIASNDAAVTNLETKLRSITIPPPDKINMLDKIIEHYDVSHIVLYNIRERSDYIKLHEMISEYITPNYFVAFEKSIDNSYLYKIKKTEEYPIGDSVINAENFEKVGDFENALKEYNAISIVTKAQISRFNNLHMTDEANLRTQFLLEVLAKKASLHELLNQSTAALAVYNDMVTIDRTNIHALTKIAEYYFRHNLLETSLNVYQNVARLDPQNESIQKQIDKINEMLNNNSSSLPDDLS